uniref:Uncharacterized protein n=1 Tax=Oryza rufipogon TaxID=4529 RepID=A0A0E0R163_ORYRU
MEDEADGLDMYHGAATPFPARPYPSLYFSSSGPTALTSSSFLFRFLGVRGRLPLPGGAPPTASAAKSATPPEPPRAEKRLMWPPSESLAAGDRSAGSAGYSLSSVGGQGGRDAVREDNVSVN